MTTNDNTRLNEKIVKSKGNGKMMKEKERSFDEKEKGYDSNQHRKMMVRSASEPRIFIQWEDCDMEEEEHDDGHEQMVIDEF